MSDWDSNSLSISAQSADTIISATFNIYSRFGRDVERRCNRYSSTDSNNNKPQPYYSLNSVLDRPNVASTLISEDGKNFKIKWPMNLKVIDPPRAIQKWKDTGRYENWKELDDTKRMAIAGGYFYDDDAFTRWLLLQPTVNESNLVA